MTNDSPVYALTDAVVEAIRIYDKTYDHNTHAADSDCVRCNLLTAMGRPLNQPLERGRTYRLHEAKNITEEVGRHLQHALDSERAEAISERLTAAMFHTQRGC